MPRKPRDHAAGGRHHVGHHSNAGRELFTDARDRRRFLRLVREAFDPHGVEVVAWCLMVSHYHLVVIDHRGQLSEAMRGLNSAYARCCNARDGHRGVVMWQRFFGAPIETERHELAVARYVPLNPVAAGYCERPEDYPWSSHRAVLLGADDPLIASPEEALRLFDGDPRRYGAWVGSDVTPSSFVPPSRLPRPVLAEVAPSLDDLVATAAPHDAARLARAWQFPLREIAEALGVSTSTVDRWAPQTSRGKKYLAPLPAG